MNSFRTHTSAGAGARLSASLFFLFFMGMGLAFCWLILRDAAPGLRTWTWTKTPCEISGSEVREADRHGRKTGNFNFQVRYHYDFGGRGYTGDRYQLKTSEFQDYAQAERLTELYRPESMAVCFVNPSAPDEAVLKRGNLLFPLLVLFPLIFVAVGALGIYSVWRPKAAGSQPPQPISEHALRPTGRSAGAFFFLIFVLLGSGFFYGFFLRPLWKVLSARQWPAVSCVVLSSEVRSHSGSHGSTTYSVNILYRYEISGREFKANRYDFIGGSSSGSRNKYDIIRRHPPGSSTVCYVNPSDPTEAVLERGFTPTMWVGLMPLVFVALGIVGLSNMLRRTRRVGVFDNGSSLEAGFSLSLSEVVPQPEFVRADEARIVRPNASPLKKLMAALLMALFWNGIISVFVLNVFKHWASPVEWFLALFMIPFVLIGLVLVGAVVYLLLALFNPRPSITLNPAVVPLGGTFRVEWAIAGRTEVLQRLRVYLEGREEATYQNGKNTATDRNVFASIEIADETVPQAMRSGVGNVTVPAEFMHSFMGSHNKILWTIRVKGEIAHWPDINEDFPLTVLPMATPTTVGANRQGMTDAFKNPYEPAPN